MFKKNLVSHFQELNHYSVKSAGSCGRKDTESERAKRNKSHSRHGELVYSAISIKEIGLHQRCEWREVIDAKLG